MQTNQEALLSEGNQSNGSKEQVIILSSAATSCLGCLVEEFESAGFEVRIFDVAGLDLNSLQVFAGCGNGVFLDVDSLGAQAFELAQTLFNANPKPLLLFSLRAFNRCESSSDEQAESAEKGNVDGLLSRCIGVFCARKSSLVFQGGEGDWGVVAPNGMHVELSAHEFIFLRILYESGEQPVSRAVIADALGRERRFIGNRLEALVSRLRRKLLQACPGWQPIRAVHGYGYAMRSEGASFPR